MINTIHTNQQLKDLHIWCYSRSTVRAQQQADCNDSNQPERKVSYHLDTLLPIWMQISCIAIYLLFWPWPLL